MIHDKRACLDKARQAMEAQAEADAREGPGSPRPPASPRRPPTLTPDEGGGSEDDEVVIRPRGRPAPGRADPVPEVPVVKPLVPMPVLMV